MFLSITLLLIGLVVLVLGAEFLVRGASSISKKAGIPPIVIGLTIVAFGTSAPELIVNVFSAFAGTTDLAIGNVVGSNVANVLLVLGASALFVDLKVHKNTTWREIPFSFLAVMVLFFMSNDFFFDHGSSNILSRSEGLTLLGFFAIFMFYTASLFSARKLSGNEDVQQVKVYKSSVAIFMTFLGLFSLFIGGKLLVNNAVILARLAGMSEMLIGLTIVAIGTSLPELATSVAAAIKKQDDLAIGNIVGSNIFNIFWILGATATISPIPLSNDANFDIFVCFFSTILLFTALLIGRRHVLQRWQGILMLLSYFIYLVYLIIRG
ncbi:MAG: calcium/sodium antiporter [Candidatus Gracilibacteria bacterium]|jgi:cation:H+ antiporter|nr:calcium/sodium antiporter [Candidatus Gracilibacteria bacterium]